VVLPNRRGHAPSPAESYGRRELASRHNGRRSSRPKRHLAIRKHRVASAKSDPVRCSQLRHTAAHIGSSTAATRRWRSARAAVEGAAAAISGGAAGSTKLRASLGRASAGIGRPATATRRWQRAGAAVEGAAAAISNGAAIGALGRTRGGRARSAARVIRKEVAFVFGVTADAPFRAHANMDEWSRD
jgi:hypothetical protein